MIHTTIKPDFPPAQLITMVRLAGAFCHSWVGYLHDGLGLQLPCVGPNWGIRQAMATLPFAATLNGSGALHSFLKAYEETNPYGPKWPRVGCSPLHTTKDGTLLWDVSETGSVRILIWPEEYRTVFFEGKSYTRKSPCPGLWVDLFHHGYTFGITRGGRRVDNEDPKEALRDIFFERSEPSGENETSSCRAVVMALRRVVEGFYFIADEPEASAHWWHSLLLEIGQDWFVDLEKHLGSWMAGWWK